MSTNFSSAIAWALVGVVALGAARPGHAAPASASASGRKSPILVLESHTGERPQAVAPLISALDDELEKRGFAAHASAILQVAAGIPRPGILDKSTTAKQIAQMVETGYDQFVNGRYKDADAVLIKATELLERNPALVVVNTSNVDMAQKAYITLALSQAKTGDPDASLTMMQAIRMFPTRPFPHADYGPDDEKFYKKVYKQIQSMGRGRLLVTTGNSQSIIFVDGQIRGVDKIELADLVPGTYRVLVQVPSTPGRSYEVEVSANDDTFVNVEPDVDASLWATDSWVGFQFASNAARANEAKLAGKVAARWSTRDLVAVVGTAHISGRLVLTGTVYTTDGTMLRSAAIDVETATPALLQALARLMAEGGAPVDGLKLLDGPALAIDAPTAQHQHHHWWSRPWPYLISGASIVAGSTIFYLAAPAYDSKDPKPYVDHRTPATYAFIGGSVVLGGGIYLWLREDKHASVISSAAIGGGVAAMFSGAMMIATNQEPGPFEPATIRRTRTPGIAWGAAGAAATGLGVFLFMRDDKPAIAPSVAVYGHHGMMTVAGSF